MNYASNGSCSNFHVPMPSGETVVAGNPFDDPPVTTQVRRVPQMQQQQQMSPHMGSPLMGQMNNMQLPSMRMTHPCSAGYMYPTAGAYVRGPEGPYHPAMQGPMYFRMNHHQSSLGQSLPPIHLCRVCEKEISDDGSDGIQCSVPTHGCYYWFHRECAKLTEDAYKKLKEEAYAEWICQFCYCAGKMDLIYHN